MESIPDYAQPPNIAIAKTIWGVGDQLAHNSSDSQSSSSPSRIPLWLDCDTGHDDAFAILLSAQCPRIELLGVSTVHGNASLEHTTNNTLSVLEAIGKREVPVYSGSRHPFCRDVVHAESIHGETGLDGTTVLPIPVAKAQRHTYGEIGAMRDALMSCPPGTAWLVTTGTLTNAALLFSAFSEVIDHIAGLSIMGGAIGSCFTYAPMGKIYTDRIILRKNLHKLQPDGLPSPDSFSNPADLVAKIRSMDIIEDCHTVTDEEILAFVNHNTHNFGNWSAYAEFNILVDPESASAIFSNEKLAAKTTMVTLDLTHQVLGTSSIMELIYFGRPADIAEGFEYPASVTSLMGEKLNTNTTGLTRKLFHEILSFFASTYASEFAMHSGPPVHDPLAVLAVLAPTLFDDNDGERFDVTVIREDSDGRNDTLETRREERDRAARGGARVSQCGRTVIKRSKSGVRIPRAVQPGVFWNLVDFALEKAEILKASQK